MYFSVKVLWTWKKKSTMLSNKSFFFNWIVFAKRKSSAPALVQWLHWEDCYHKLIITPLDGVVSPCCAESEIESSLADGGRVLQSYSLQEEAVFCSGLLSEGRVWTVHFLDGTGPLWQRDISKRPLFYHSMLNLPVSSSSWAVLIRHNDGGWQYTPH